MKLFKQPFLLINMCGDGNAAMPDDRVNHLSNGLSSNFIALAFRAVISIAALEQMIYIRLVFLSGPSIAKICTPPLC